MINDIILIVTIIEVYFMSKIGVFVQYSHSDTSVFNYFFSIKLLAPLLVKHTWKYYHHE